MEMFGTFMDVGKEELYSCYGPFNNFETMQFDCALELELGIKPNPFTNNMDEMYYFPRYRI